MRMARRSGGTHKGVEEKRRSLPIYQHYTLSPGKTKSHHPEAKCNHCLKEFVCGSKQRLIRHLRKCSSITNPEQIIAETLNTLARNSATGQLNHSILEASNLLPSQISHIHHSATQIVGHSIHNSTASSSSTITTANNHHNTSSSNNNTSNNSNNNINNNNNNNNNNNISESNNVSAQNTSGSSLHNDHALVASSSNGSMALNDVLPVKRPLKRGRKPGTRNSVGPGIQVTTGIDGKTHFTATTQFQEPVTSGQGQIISQVHNGRGFGYTSYQATTGTSSISASGSHMNTGNSGQMPCTTVSHNSSFKLNPEPIDKAYLKLVVTRNLPLSLCDTKEFHSWLKTFANDYKPPTSINLIAQNLKNDAQAAKQRVSNILVKAPKKTINLELHGWPHELRGHSWYAIIAGIDHKRFLLSMRDVASTMNNDTTDSGDGAVEQKFVPSDKALTEFVDDCIKRVGSDRVNSLLFAEKGGDDDFIARTRQSIYSNHPSIVTYHCWWHFTNILCLDIVEQIDVYRTVLRNSKLLMDFISKRPQLSLCLEKFSPFAGYANSSGPKREDPRWYSHLICYLFEYLKNNNEAILKALENYSPTTHSDNNNNSSGAGNKSQSDVQQNSTSSSSTQQQNIFCQDVQLIEMKSIVMSTEYWANLNSALVHLKPIRDIVALIANLSTQAPCSNANSNQSGNSTPKNQTQAISTISTSNLSLSEYMRWYLGYGKSLLDSWRQSPDSHKFKIIRNYLERFSASLTNFKLLFAAYLLNPKNRCAYMTQKAKDSAIEEILNIASEFMPEESDGHTIFDQWKLYLIREEPYDASYDETRSTPLEWWLSLPCAESIRRVALRILRLRAFTSPKPESLFSQLYFYEDETKSSLPRSTFEDLANIRYFYDYEDKIGHQANSYNSSSQNHSHNHSLISLSSNGFQDRTQSGLLHNQHLHDADDPDNFLPSGPLQVAESNGQYCDSIPVNEQSKTNFSDQYSDIVEPYLNQSHHMDIDSQASLNNAANLSVENLPEYAQFADYVDFNLLGIQIVEEPTEKKKRKWTAQEILSKQCQNNHQSSGNISNDI